MLMAPGRPSPSGNGFNDGTPNEYAAAGKHFIYGALKNPDLGALGKLYSENYMLFDRTVRY
jgi:hypothetical protein